jgi:transcriptional regulator with XRE-family HTH domain
MSADQTLHFGDPRAIGDRLQQLRKDDGFTAFEIASDLKVTQFEYDQLEAGRVLPTEDLAHRIANKFGINVTWFLTGEGEQFISRSGELSRERVFQTLISK